jgi:hypothetical protein
MKVLFVYFCPSSYFYHFLSGIDTPPIALFSNILSLCSILRDYETTGKNVVLYNQQFGLCYFTENDATNASSFGIYGYRFAFCHLSSQLTLMSFASNIEGKKGKR